MSSTSGGALRSLRQYTEDSFRFSIPEQVYQFLSALCDSSSKKSWSTKDAQSQLHEFVEGNGILRLTDALCFPKDTSRPWSFQRGYIPIFVYMTSDSVIKKALHADINKLYGVIYNNFDAIRDTIEAHMPRLIEARSFKDGLKPFSGRVIFKALFTTLYEYVHRFRVAASNLEVRQLAEHMSGWFDVWATGLSSNPPFDDDCVRFDNYQKESIIENIDSDKERLLSLIKEPMAVTRKFEQGGNRQEVSQGLIANLQRILDNDGPGRMRKAGRRHDNDYVKIQDIRVPPTPDELLCEEDSYLPGNFFEAPHQLKPGSAERLFDIQFRLLREEMTGPIRTAMQCIISDLKKPASTPTILSKIIREGGGRYRSLDAQDSVIFSVFTNITFRPLSLDSHGVSLGVEFDAPPGDARSESPEARTTYWERTAKKRLTQGALVALIYKESGSAAKVEVHLGTVTSTPMDLLAAARRSSDRISIKISFFDPAFEFRVLRMIQNRMGTYGTWVLIEAPVFYEGVRPFLEALQRNPRNLPFLKHLRHQGKSELKNQAVQPPSYSTISNFSFDLTELFPQRGARPLYLNTIDPGSVYWAKTSLLRGSRLDPSQVQWTAK